MWRSERSSNLSQARTEAVEGGWRGGEIFDCRMILQAEHAEFALEFLFNLMQGRFVQRRGVTLGWQQGDDQSPTQQGRVGERLARRNDFQTIVCERSAVAKRGNPRCRARAKLSKQLEVRRRTSLFKLV